MLTSNQSIVQTRCLYHQSAKLIQNDTHVRAAKDARHHHSGGMKLLYVMRLAAMHEVAIIVVGLAMRSKHHGQSISPMSAYLVHGVEMLMKQVHVYRDMCRI